MRRLIIKISFFIVEQQRELNDVVIKKEGRDFQADNDTINLPYTSSSVIWIKTENVSSSHELNVEDSDVETDAFDFQHVSLLN